MADILSCLDPKLQSLYEARKAQHSDSLWNFSWPNLSKDKKRWYLPVRWDGTSRLVFVAQQPSTGSDFPDRKNRRFWDLVVKCGLARKATSPPEESVRVYYEGPYATNLVPVRDEVEEAKKNLPNWPESEWANDFWDELKVVDPILIVAEGEKVFNALSRLPGLNVRLERVTVIWNGNLKRLILCSGN